MKKLIKVKAIRDEFMEYDGEQFCIKNKEYKVLRVIIKEGFYINSELGDNHFFEFNNCEYFELIYEDDKLSEVNKKILDYEINCIAMSIVNYINEINNVSVDTRQKNNDECFDYVVMRIKEKIENLEKEKIDD